jgi:hypothetical protein
MQMYIYCMFDQNMFSGLDSTCYDVIYQILI